MNTHQLLIDQTAPTATVAGNTPKRLPRHGGSQDLYKDACVDLIREVRP
jgi:hypothetical protein